jgi:hypothetical protein
MDRRVWATRADHQDRARAGARAHEDVLGAGGTVDEVPGPKAPLLAVDDPDALTRQHQEVLLHALGVILPVRFSGLQQVDVDAVVREEVVGILEAHV